MRVVICGDFLFSSRGLAKRIDPKIVELLQSADAVFANAEFSTPKWDTPPGFTMYLTSVPQNRLDEFVDLNIKLVCFANNHTVDYGWLGAQQTLEAALERDLVPCGLGRNLDDARKPRFLDTPAGRIGVVTASTTWPDKGLASNGNADVVARPGLSPLRWKRTIVLPEADFKKLRQISKKLGLEDSNAEVSRIECWPAADESHFIFGFPMEEKIPVELGETAEVREDVNEEDQAALLRSVADARKRSDFVLVNVHTHEGENENWYGVNPPKFLIDYAHAAIDAGADVVAYHGAHCSRGGEIYKGKPIFYNMGSLVMEFETGESMISPEMYKTYHHPVDALPSDLHTARAKNPDGSWNGF